MVYRCSPRRRSCSWDGGRTVPRRVGDGGAYFREKRVGRGLAWADYDNDGRPDLAVSHNGGPAALLRNRTDTTNNWVRLELVGDGKTSNRNAVGARVEVESRRVKQVRFVIGGGSYLSASERRLLSGWASDEGGPGDGPLAVGPRTDVSRPGRADMVAAPGGGRPARRAGPRSAAPCQQMNRRRFSLYSQCLFPSGNPPMILSLDERRLRIDLAACYRLVALYGWDDIVFTHISREAARAMPGS